MQTQNQVVLNCQKVGLDEQDFFFHAYLEEQKKSCFEGSTVNEHRNNLVLRNG